VATIIKSLDYETGGVITLSAANDLVIVVEDATYVSSGNGISGNSLSSGNRIQIDGNLIATGDSGSGYGIITSRFADVTIGREGQVVSAKGGFAAIHLGGNGTGADSSGTLTNAGEIIGTSGFGLILSGGGNTVINSGLISGNAAPGLYVDDESSLDYIANTGLITSTAGSALESQNGTTRVDNSGTIVSTSIGMAGRFASIDNSGLIQGGTIGILMAGSGVAITNSGIIAGEGTAILLNSADSDIVVNRGLIDGEVYLGLGNDIFDTRDGTVLGKVAGQLGNDTYMVSSTMTEISEVAGEGTDAVHSSISWSLGANLEDLVLLGNADINGTGNSADNLITGNQGNNRLNGGGGNDFLSGGDGDDTYIVDGGDAISENAGEGTDTVLSSATVVVLSSQIENLVLTGSGAINGTGNAQDNVMTGNRAANTLSGGAGADTLIGGRGDDVYVIDAADVISENAGGGRDTVRAGFTYALGVNVENLQLLGAGALSGTGNAGANTLTGNSGNNTLSGSGGNDLLEGGGGADRLAGGSGADAFLFRTAPGAANVDRITDFRAADDTIRIDNAVFTGLAGGALAGAAFQANSSGNAADASDRIIYESDTGKLFFDSDGTGAAAKVHFATLGTGLSLTAADFVVV
jgi:Ca2+-binding RTX toxin-like protein